MAKWKPDTLVAYVTDGQAKPVGVIEMRREPSGECEAAINFETERIARKDARALLRWYLAAAIEAIDKMDAS